MKRILVINPNTTEAVTGMVVDSCKQAYPDIAWDGATSRFGAAYVSSETAYAIAGHAVLETFAEHCDGCVDTPDAVLIACFGDPGLLALREVAGRPVLGLAQASFEAAAKLGPFAVVTGGKVWEPMLARFARTYSLDAQLVGIHAVELTGGQIAAAPQSAYDSLYEACLLGIRSGAKNIVLGGAALAGMAGMLQKRLSIPVLDNVLLGAQAAVEAAGQPAADAGSSGVDRPAKVAGSVKGLGTALSRLLA